MAPKTSKEKSISFRKKLKLNVNKHMIFKEKDAKRKRESRMKQKRMIQEGVLTVDIINQNRRKETLRKRLYRLRKRERLQETIIQQEETISAFKTLVVKKIKSVLPKCPDKKKEVLKKLFFAEFPQVSSVLSEEKVRPWNKLDSHFQESVERFYTRDDISRQAPGKRDVVAVKDDRGKKEKIQKRHMTITVKEAYHLFISENPEINIKLTKFYEYRPKHVLLSSSMPHDVCICKYHANFNFVVEAISKHVSGFPKNSRELLSAICCQIDSFNCMNNLCVKCDTDIEFALIPLITNVEAEIKWKKWQINLQRPQVLEISGTLKAALDQLQESLETFKIHCFVKTIQERHFETEKRNLNEENVVLQVDFAENYSCISQDEIQSAHWSHRQVTIFTAVAWTNNTHHSFAAISDELSHDKFAVWVFLKEIIQWLRNTYSALINVSIFSDGCAAQFKNKYTISNLCYMQEDFGILGYWNFFATSHGKGAVDGVGGKLKRVAWEMVRGRKVLVNDSRDFFDVLKDKTNINLIYVSSQKIQENKDMLTSRWKNVLAIPGLQSCHFFRPTADKALEIGQTHQNNIRKVTVIKH